MSELTPITRIESYLDAIVNSGTPPLEDITRIETFLQAIYDNQVCALTPITRIEMFLGKISGQSLTLPEPVTRVELYLAAIAGEDVELPENPITRLEMYLAEWADSGDLTTISGAIVEFITQRAHKLKSCVVDLEPKQDLHGYDSPWPGGGGKNLFKTTLQDGSNEDMSWTVDSNGVITVVGKKAVTYATIDIGTFEAKAGVTYALNGCPPGGSLSTQRLYFRYSSGEEYDLGEGSTFSRSEDTTLTLALGVGQINTFVFKPMVRLASVADATFAPYENICPISGYTGVEAIRTGKNLLDMDNPDGLWGATCTKNEDGSITVVTSSGGGASVQYLLTGKLKPGTYTVTNLSVRNLYVQNNASDYTHAVSTGNSYTFNYDGESYLRLVFTNQTSNTTDTYKVQLELGSTATDYIPYNGNSYSVTWEDEVYGATPDIVSGDMPVTKNLITIGSLSWDYYNGLFYANVVGKANNNASTNIICSVYAQGSRNATGAGDAASILQDKQITGFYDPNSANSWVYVKDSAYATVLAFKTAMRDQTICYELATPVETTITPTPITALKGYNAMWSDGGDIEVTVHGTPVEVETLQALNMLLGGAYRNNQTADDVSDEEALDIILGG